jgi:hypothetical protein
MKPTSALNASRVRRPSWDDSDGLLDEGEAVVRADPDVAEVVAEGNDLYTSSRSSLMFLPILPVALWAVVIRDPDGVVARCPRTGSTLISLPAPAYRSPTPHGP